MKKIFFLFVLLLLICCPVAMAGNFTNADTIQAGYVADTYSASGTLIHYDLSDGAYAVTALQITAYHRPSDTDFTLYMLDGSTHTGSIIYSNLTAISCDTTLILDGNTKHWTYYAPGGVDLLNTYIGTYATNTDTGDLGILLAEEWITTSNIDHYVFSSDSFVADYPITAIDITASDEVNAVITYASIDSVIKEIKDENDNSVLGYATRLLSFVGSIVGIIFAIMSAFVSIFVAHFFEILVLYEAVIIAYTAHNSRDLISWFKKFVRYNTKFFDFWIDFVSRIVDIFYKIIKSLITWWS